MKQIQQKRAGFSLVEVAIAMAVVAIVITSFISVFGPAKRSINQSVNIKETNRLVDTLNYEMTTLKPGQESLYPTSFHKVFDWLRNFSPEDTPASAAANQRIIMYQYRGDVSVAPRSAGASTPEDFINALVPFQSINNQVAGENYTTVTAVRPLRNTTAVNNLIEEELDPIAIAGNTVFAVRFRQLAPNTSGDLELQNYGVIVDPQTGNPVANANDYTAAYIAFQAEFYLLKTSSPGYVISSNWQFEELGKPVFVRNLSVNR